MRNDSINLKEHIDEKDFVGACGHYLLLWISCSETEGRHKGPGFYCRKMGHETRMGGHGRKLERTNGR